MLEFVKQHKFWDRLAITGLDDCWLWQGCVNNKGYGRLKLKDITETYAHRAAYVLAVGCIPDDLQVLHTCDTPRCCNPKHLVVGTNDDNMGDKVAKQRQARGRPQALAIKAMPGLQREIALKFGVTQMLVSKIKQGLVWKHLC
jgi:hypothetical protein